MWVASMLFAMQVLTLGDLNGALAHEGYSAQVGGQPTRPATQADLVEAACQLGVHLMVARPMFNLERGHLDALIRYVRILDSLDSKKGQPRRWKYHRPKMSNWRP
jgi:hypothetical protein